MTDGTVTSVLAFAAGLPDFDLAVAAESPVVAMAVEWTMRVVYAALILTVGLWLAFFISGQVKKRVSGSRRVDATLGRFFGTVTRYVLVIVVMIAVLQKFGVQTTSLVAMLGAATLAIGLALQGALGDLAAGVLIIVFRPYRLGDFVEIGGKSGTVDDISLFYTALNTIDNRRVVIPNGMAWGDAIENYSANAARRIDLTVGISYEDDIDHAIAVVRQTIDGFGDIHKEPAPQVAVRELADSSVNLVVRCWTATESFMGTQWELNKRIKQAFDANGVTIPYPHQVAINRIEAGPDESATEEALSAQGMLAQPEDGDRNADGDGDRGADRGA